MYFLNQLDFNVIFVEILEITVKQVVLCILDFFFPVKFPDYHLHYIPYRA